VEAAARGVEQSTTKVGDPGSESEWTVHAVGESAAAPEGRTGFVDSTMIGRALKSPRVPLMSLQGLNYRMRDKRDKRPLLSHRERPFEGRIVRLNNLAKPTICFFWRLVEFANWPLVASDHSALTIDHKESGGTL
jgi:hypothetical protein